MNFILLNEDNVRNVEYVLHLIEIIHIGEIINIKFGTKEIKII